MDSIADFKVFKSQLYGLGDTYSFNLNSVHFYICNDYSLDENLRYVENILSEINHVLEGRTVDNPNVRHNEARYMYSMGGNEYYLWRAGTK